MGDPKRLEQISKILDFVTGKGVPNGMRGYDQRLSSWLLMASDLIPFLPNTYNKQGSVQQPPQPNATNGAQPMPMNDPNYAMNSNYTNTMNDWSRHQSIDRPIPPQPSGDYSMGEFPNYSSSVPVQNYAVPPSYPNYSMNMSNEVLSSSAASVAPSTSLLSELPSSSSPKATATSKNESTTENPSSVLSSSMMNSNYPGSTPIQSSLLPSALNDSTTNSTDHPSTNSVNMLPMNMSSNGLYSFNDYPAPTTTDLYANNQGNSMMPQPAQPLSDMLPLPGSYVPPTANGATTTPANGTAAYMPSKGNEHLTTYPYTTMNIPPYEASLSMDSTIHPKMEPELHLTSKESTKRTLEEEDEYKDDKRQKRLEKNRIIARNCRKRKKEKLIALEEEICQLKAENDEMKRQLLKGDGEEEKEKKQIFYANRLRMLLNQNASDEELQKEINSYFENWKYNNNERFNNAKYHLEQLKMLLLPTQVTKMCVWSLHQDDEFYDEKMNEIKYGGSIWNIVASFTNMTPEQKKSILSMRTETNEPIDNMNKILQIIDKLQENIKENFNISCEQLSSIMKVLTPRQQTMFLLWCENNKGKNQLLSLLFSVLHKEDTNDDILSDSSDDNNDTVEL